MLGTGELLELIRGGANTAELQRQENQNTRLECAKMGSGPIKTQVMFLTHYTRSFYGCE